MRRDTLKSPYGPHKGLEGDKRGWNDDHRGEYDRFKYIGRSKCYCNGTRQGIQRCEAQGSVKPWHVDAYDSTLCRKLV
jgi:hypothetical protein